MSEEKQVPSGDEEANNNTPENTPASEAGEPTEPQPETNEASLEATAEAETVAVSETEDATEEDAASVEESASAEPAKDKPAVVEAAQETEETPATEESPELVTEPTAEEAKTVVETVQEAEEAPVTEESPEPATEPASEEAPTQEAEMAPAEAVATEDTATAQEKEKAPATTEAEAPAEVVESQPEADSDTSETTAAPIADGTTETATTPESKTESSETTEAKSEIAEAAAGDGTAETEASEVQQEEVEEDIDYSTYTREQLAEVVDELSKQDNFKKSDTILSKVLPLFKGMARARRQEAMEKFLADGGAQDDFEYRHDEVFNHFDASVRLIRDRRASFFKEREARKEENYQKKLEILNKLRELVDGENSTTNLSPIKALQDEWKNLGPVPNQHNRTLWANYNALLDRFYHNRNILFELKELDRKKNLVKKTELCGKAEALDKLENIKDAIIQLNELHDEYKKIGAVPREVQETLWQRFKTASDAIYKKRKSYLEDLKGELQQNLEKKRVLAQELSPYLDFDSDRINDWNAKTKEILAIQKRWDALGGLPREHAKDVNKAFWSAFKGFFGRKNAFFKKLEGMRHENLQKKEELVAKALEFAESKEWDKTSEALKGLQRQWKEIGPVPEKHRNSVYAKFKEACDTFFNNKRASQDKAEEQFVENQKHKEDLIKEVRDRAAKGDGEAGELDDIMTRWNAIGFVPRSAIKKVEDNFAKAVDGFVKSLKIEDKEREALVMKAELSSLKKGPNSDRRLNRKESDLRRKVQEVEDNISLWNNNLSFFANSKGADKLRAEYDQKIADAEEELVQLKKQLRLVRSM